MCEWYACFSHVRSITSERALSLFGHFFTLVQTITKQSRLDRLPDMHPVMQIWQQFDMWVWCLNNNPGHVWGRIVTAILPGHLYIFCISLKMESMLDLHKEKGCGRKREQKKKECKCFTLKNSNTFVISVIFTSTERNHLNKLGKAVLRKGDLSFWANHLFISHKCNNLTSTFFIYFSFSFMPSVKCINMQGLNFWQRVSSWRVNLYYCSSPRIYAPQKICFKFCIDWWKWGKNWIEDSPWEEMSPKILPTLALQGWISSHWSYCSFWYILPPHRPL